MSATKDRILRAVTLETEGAVLYIRQSITRVKKDAQGRKTSELDTVSPEIQERAGRAYCAAHGYHVVAVVTDLNRTGRTLARRKVQEAVGFIEHGEARVIVVWKWSRMSRSRRDWAVTCDAIETRYGGRLESSTEPVDITTATGRLNRGILAEFAAFESDRQGEIIKEVQDNRARQGLPGNGKDRFGYQNVDKRFVVDPVTGPALAEAYRLYLGGAGYTAVARWLNDHGHRTTYDSHFRHGTVRLMLDSGFGAGLFLHRGEHLQGVHDPVITMEEWAQYKAARQVRSKLPSRAKSSCYLLVGLIKCGLCGTSMTAKLNRGHYWYRCKSRTEVGCPNPMVKLPNVEAKVFEWLRDLVGEINASTRVNRRREERRAANESRAAGLRRQIIDRNKQLTSLTIDRSSGLVPDEAYVMARDEILAARKRLEEELADADRRTQVGPAFDMAEYAGLVEDWDVIPVEGRREALRRILKRVRVWSRPLAVKCVATWEDDVP